jgi:hypothetical protein
MHPQKQEKKQRERVEKNQATFLLSYITDISKELLQE